jgi:hypothetical protein
MIAEAIRDEPAWLYRGLHGSLATRWLAPGMRSPAGLAISPADSTPTVTLPRRGRSLARDSPQP